MRNKELFRGRRKAGRLVGLVLTLALAVSLLSGCGQSKERLTFGTGGTAGTYYSYGGVLAQYITNNTNVKVTAVSTGGSKANLQSVQDGDFQLGFVQSGSMVNSWTVSAYRPPRVLKSWVAPSCSNALTPSHA